MKNRTLSIGVISEGTCKAIDIADALWSALDGVKLSRIDRGHLRSLRADLDAVQDDEDENADTALDVLIAIADNYTPAYCRVGNIEGDGACFGVWPTPYPEEIDALRVADLADVPRGYRGEVLYVNDHGNVTLYVAGRRGLREIWSVV